MQVNNLSIKINKDNRIILDKVNFSVNSEDKVVIIGEEGNGKSTLMKCIYDRTLVEDYATVTGQIVIAEHSGYLPQEMEVADKQKTVYEYFNSSHMFSEAQPKKLAQISAQLGLDADIFYGLQLVETLSGGEKVKIQLARILLGEPDLLLLDEPSNDLDISTLLWLEDFINGTDKGVIFISHDETLIENTANRIIHIEQLIRKSTPRVTVCDLGYREYIEQRQGNIAKQMQVANKEKAEHLAKVERWREIYEKVDRDQRNISRGNPHGGKMLKKKMKTVKSQERRLIIEESEMTPLPEFEEAILTRFDQITPIPNGKVVLDFSLDKLEVGEKNLARNLALSINGPKHVCIVGSNGVGKTTLLKKIFEKLETRRDISVAYMPQNYIELLPLDITPIEYLSKNFSKAAMEGARTLLGCMKYRRDEMEHAIRQLSGGQRAKLLYLNLVLSGANVLLLDEPTRNFSPLSNPVIRQMLKEFRGAILAVSHDRKFIDEVCDTVYEMTPDGLKRIE